LPPDSGWNTGGTGGTIDFGWNSKALLEAFMHQAKLARGGDNEDDKNNISLPAEKAIAAEAAPVKQTAQEAEGDEQAPPGLGGLKQHRGLGGIALPVQKQAEEDDNWEGVMGQQLKAMVQELAGEEEGEEQFSFIFGCEDEEDLLRPNFGEARDVSANIENKSMIEDEPISMSTHNTYKEQQQHQALLEDAMSKVDAARDALLATYDNAVMATTQGDVDVTLRGAAPEFVPGQLWQGSQRSCFVD
jgi:hypothetical protein